MKKKTERKIIIISIIIIIICVFGIYKVITINKAHETFEGYCQWRGDTVVSFSGDYGLCKNIASGKIEKIVLFNGKWYLDGDLPCGFLCF